jgi:hypothetical protein
MQFCRGWGYTPTHLARTEAANRPLVVVNTKLPWGKHGRPRRIDTMAEDSGTTWGLAPFIRAAGIVHTRLSKSNSLHVARATSFSRVALRTSIWKTLPTG